MADEELSTALIQRFLERHPTWRGSVTLRKNQPLVINSEALDAIRRFAQTAEGRQIQRVAMVSGLAMVFTEECPEWRIELRVDARSGKLEMTANFQAVFATWMTEHGFGRPETLRDVLDAIEDRRAGREGDGRVG